jgi:hypothetical protein
LRVVAEIAAKGGSHAGVHPVAYAADHEEETDDEKQA